MALAVFAGSFDPPTFGHLDIVNRAAKIFTELHVVIAVNSEKKALFSEDERLTMMQELLQPLDNVTVVTWDSLIADYARSIGAKTLVRGIRNVADFSYEFDLALLNRTLGTDLDTVFLVTDPRYFVLRSSAIKELAKFHGDLSGMVPPLVAEALYKKFPQNDKDG